MVTSTLSSSISVVIPTYNRGHAIARTIDSVLEQTLLPLEIIVVDDGSTDGTADFVESHYATQSLVQVIRQTNGGVARARNRGLEKAQGEFIAYLDHDDTWLPTKLQEQFARLQKNIAIGVVYSLWNHVKTSGEIIQGGFERSFGANVQWPEGQVFTRFLKRNYIISMSVPMMRTALVREVGGFDPQTVPCDDWDLWLRLAEKCQFSRIDKPLVNYTEHENQQSKDALKMLRASRRTLQKHLPHLMKRPVLFWIFLAYPYFFRTYPFYIAVREAILSKNWREAKRQALLCFRRCPLMFLTPQWIYVFRRIIMKDSRPL